MIINHNLSALNTSRQLGINGANTQKSLEKLSSGLRINKAGDDAAGLAISEKMRGQIRGLDQASRNAQDGISLIQTAEGALSETHSILQRMRELAVQSANGTYESTAGSDRAKLQEEVNQLNSEVNRIANATEFNKQKLLDGSKAGAYAITTRPTGFDNSKGYTAIDVSGLKGGAAYAAGDITFTQSAAGLITVSDAKTGVTQSITVAAGAVAADTTKVVDFDMIGVKLTLNSSYTAGTAVAAAADAVVGYTAGNAGLTFQIGANGSTDERLQFNISKMDNSATGINTVSVDVASQSGAQTAIGTIDTAIASVSTERSKLGALQNRLEHTVSNLGTSGENMTAAESRIRDVDMAKEMMEFTKNNILSQAAQAMLAQANQQPQGVLQLLR